MIKQSQGFTLIELMIVVAIIGILAAIAVPQYQTFIAKSQASESIVMMDTARIMVEDHVISLGSFPLNKAALINLDIKVAGTYGSITGVNTPVNDSGTLVYKLSSNQVNKNISEASVWFNRETRSGAWTCNSNLADKYAPKGCTFSNSAPNGS